jgi:circadian clock protein KaiB
LYFDILFFRQVIKSEICNLKFEIKLGGLMTKAKVQKTSSYKTTAAFEKAIKIKSDDSVYVLRLYVVGLSPRSRQAITNIKKLCDEHLKGRYELEIVDIYQQPAQAKEAELIAAPTLIKKLPLPLRRFIGDMSNKDRILIGLGVKGNG